MTYYEKHIFICTNQKSSDKKCCANAGAVDFFHDTKVKLQALDLHGPGKIRISQSGCLGRCTIGPCLVIYPEAVWYTYATKEDIDDIIAVHLIEGKRVHRLLLD